MCLPLRGGAVSVQHEPQRRIPMSWEEYCRLPEKPKAEWVDGVVVVIPPAAGRHSYTAVNLAAVLKSSLPDLKVLSQGGVALPRNRRRIPDLMVVRAVHTGLWAEEPPVLVVEILSPSTRREDLVRKFGEYAEGGIGQYWVVDLDVREVEVFGLTGDHYESLLVLDQTHPSGEIAVGEHGVVRLDLAELFDG